MSAPEIINPGAASGGAPVGGSGTPGKLAKFTGAGTSIGDSVVTELTGKIGINVVPGTLLSVGDGIVSPPSYDGIRLGNTAEALFSSSDSIRGFRAGVTGATVVAGSTTSHDLLLQRGNVTALTLGASGAVTFAGNLTSSSAAQTWTLAAGTSALNIASNLLNLDTTNSRVGIGTASPTHKLQVVGELGLYNAGVDAVYGDVLFMGAAAYQTTFRHKIKASISATATSSLMTFSLTSGASTFIDVMTLRGDGSVGIGTTSPSAPLAFGKSVYASPTSEDFYRIKLEDTGGVANDVGIGQPASGSLAFNWNSSGSLIFYQANAATPERMRIDSSGNVGIGTASPTGRLHVVGGTAAAATNGAPVTIIAQSAGTGNQNGGNIVLTPGALSGSGSAGVADLSGPTGTGLKLPATPGNADSQTLDCYAEGTWTPTLSAAASWGGAQPTLSAARYVRIGSTVHCTVVLIGAPNFTSTYLATTITAPFSATYNAAVSISIGAPASGCAQHNAGGTTLFLPTFGFVQSATFSWTFIV